MKAMRQRGFSLAELMITVAILSIVVGVVMSGVTTMQKTSASQVNKVDLTQQAREFMDQIVNDIHQAGYPGLNMFDPASVNTTDCTVAADVNVACGLVSVSSTALQFEGDIDGTGVSEIFIQLYNPNGTCPCTLRRGTVTKAQYQAGTTPLYYTEVDNVMNISVFQAFAYDGTTIALPANHAGANLPNILAIGITLFVQAPAPDQQTGVYPTVTMVATAKISNIQSL